MNQYKNINYYSTLNLNGGSLSFSDNLLDIYAIIEFKDFRIILKNIGDNFEIIGTRKSDLLNFYSLKIKEHDLLNYIQKLIDSASEKMLAIPERKSSQFAPFDKSTHEARMKRIKALSKRQYMDDGPVALYHALLQLKEKGFDGTLEWALLELEKLYKLNEEAPIE
jgi:hypothetical protein